MSEYFDSDDPFADLTADDLDILENAAIARTQTSQHSLQHQHQQPLLPRPRTKNAFPVLQEEPMMEDDYGQFNVDDEDLFIQDDNTCSEPPRPPPPPASHFPTNIDQTALMQELAYLRAETSRLKLERDKFETLTFKQDGRMDHLERALTKTRTDHELILQRLKVAAENEKQLLKLEVEDRERKLKTLSADIEFSKNELREAREIAGRGGIIRPATNLNNGNYNGDVFSSPKKAARIVKGSGVKSPESKSRIGAFSARAFSKEESVGPARKSNNNDNYNKKRKREEPRMITPEPVIVSEDLNETEINRIVMEKVLRDRSSWMVSDERFEVCFSKRVVLIIAYAGYSGA